jgi:selenide,water dikinase
VSARVEVAAVPVIEGVPDLLASGEGVSGGNRRNREFAAGFTSYAADGPEPLRALLADPMTSGGLLVAVAEEKAGEMGEALRGAAPETAAIGSLGTGEAGRISAC